MVVVVVLVSRRERLVVGGGVVLASGGSQRERLRALGGDWRRQRRGAETGQQGSRADEAGASQQQAKRCAKEEKGSKSR